MFSPHILYYTYYMLQYWNQELANYAQAWAEVCEWEHGQVKYDPSKVTYNPMGQNLFFAAGALNVIQSIDLWYSKEKPHYNITTHGCTWMCGHYTQVTKHAYANT